jgi:hypothetical protein
MKMSRWTNYDKYIVLADNSSGRLKGTFNAFLNFKKSVDILDKMMSSQKTNIYIGEGEVIVLDGKDITASDATNILSNINECKWTPVTAKILHVASVMKLQI